MAATAMLDLKTAVVASSALRAMNASPSFAAKHAGMCLGAGSCGDSLEMSAGKAPIAARIMRKVLIALSTITLAFAMPPAPPAVDPGERLLVALRAADSVTIQFHSPVGKEEVTFVDVFWIERLAAVLAFSSYKPENLCFCTAYPVIRLLRQKEVIGAFSVHHGTKLRAFVGSVSGDFVVGDKTGRAILALANEKRKGRQGP